MNSSVTCVFPFTTRAMHMFHSLYQTGRVDVISQIPVDSWVMSVFVMDNKIKSPEPVSLCSMRRYCECPGFCSEAE